MFTHHLMYSVQRNRILPVTLVVILAAAFTPTLHAQNIARGKPVTYWSGTFPSGAPLNTLTDGTLRPAGTHWQIGTVWWSGNSTHLHIDLQGVYEIDSAIIQADNNDTYVLMYRAAGAPGFTTLWTAPPVFGGHGMRSFPDNQNPTKRFYFPPVRAEALLIRGTGGDNLYSLSEVQVFATDSQPRSVLETSVKNAMDYHVIPGVSACAVRGSQILACDVWGLMNIAAQKPVTQDTLFGWASVSKTVTATALMQLVEQGLIDLDDPINMHLPFNVTHPLFPGTPIRVGMILNHAGSIRDNWDAIMASSAVNADSPQSLTAFLKSYLTPGGSLYSQSLNFHPIQPGSGHVYTNAGFAVAGAIVEHVTGMAFQDYVQKYIFEPLGISNASWFISDLDLSQVAMPYWLNGSVPTPAGHLHFANHPSSFLRTSPASLAKFLNAHMNDGAHHAASILQPGTAANMHAPKPPAWSYGYGFFNLNSFHGSPVLHIGHNGLITDGHSAMLLFAPARKVGAVVAINSAAYNGMEQITAAVLDYAEQITIGDVDGDGVVNVIDLLTLLATWGSCPNAGACPADLDGNGVVNVLDLLALLTNWG